MTKNKELLDNRFNHLLDCIAGAAYHLTTYHRDDQAALEALRSLAYALGHAVNAAKKTKQLGES